MDYLDLKRSLQKPEASGNILEEDFPQVPNENPRLEGLW